MYRKFTATQLFDGHLLHPAGQVLITSPTGVVLDLVPLDEAGDDVMHFDGMLCPGFINAHCHLELSHMKGCIPQGTGLVDFVLRVIRERHFSADEILTAISQAEDAMLENGIVAVGDICNTAFTLQQKQLRRLRYHNFVEVSGVPPSVASARFSKAEELYQQLSVDAPASIVPHAPYSVSANLFELINAAAAGKVLTMHNQETAAEDALFQAGAGDFLRLFNALQIDHSGFVPSGKSSIATVLPWLSQPEALLLVHNVFSSAADMRMANVFALEAGVSLYWCICANANRYISGVLPDVPLMLQENCRMVLGTDSLASNTQLNILEEIKVLQQSFPALAIDTLLQWATSNGAAALQLDHQFGSFEKYKTPGVLCIDGMEGSRLSGASSVTRLM